MSPVLTSVRLQSQVIHALHGVSPSGDWFLMADVGSRHADDAKLRGVDELPLDDTWIVIVGQRDRDIITTQDATD